MNQKIKTYVNLAIKSGQVARGTDNILKLKHAELIIISPELSNNAKNKIQNKNLGDCLINGEILPEGVLALAILNENLALQIKQLQ